MIKVAFICVHNSCRSQIAEALGKHFASDVFENYSAGTGTKPNINQDAVRLMKELYGIDMEKTQRSKLLEDIPPVDIVVTMGCNVACPYLPCKKREDWGLDDNITNENSRIKVLYNDYIEELKLTTSKGNWSNIDYFGQKVLKKIGNKKISDITEQNLQDIINKAFAAGLAKKTLTSLKAMIMQFLKFCRKRKSTNLFPENLYIPKGAKVSKKNILQPDDITKLFTSTHSTYKGKVIDDFFINAYRFQVVTGLRPGELIELRSANIKDGMVYIKGSINMYGERTNGKNNNAIRHFGLSAMGEQIIKDQKALLKKHDIKSKYMFPCEEGDFMKQQNYAKHWKRYCNYNDIPYVTPYELRHTFVSIAKNLSEGKIRPLVGHSKNMDTFGTYGHEMNGELKQTASQIDTLFKDILKAQ